MSTLPPVVRQAHHPELSRGIGLDSWQARRPRASEVERHAIALGARVRRLGSVLFAIAAEAFMNVAGYRSERFRIVTRKE